MKTTHLQPGTVIATFNSNDDYQGSQFAKNVSGVAHTALYVKHDADAIVVVEQYAGLQTIARGRITYAPSSKQTKDANNYYVVELKPGFGSKR